MKMFLNRNLKELAMLIDFNQKEEITIPGMNNGTGMMTAKMYMDEQRKVIPCSIHAGGFIVFAQA